MRATRIRDLYEAELAYINIVAGWLVGLLPLPKSSREHPCEVGFHSMLDADSSVLQIPGSGCVLYYKFRHPLSSVNSTVAAEPSELDSEGITETSGTSRGGAMERVRRWTVGVALIVLLISQVPETRGQFLVGFYDQTCPQAESLISQTVSSAVAGDITLAASVLRFSFHDCFVQGCDASVLLDSTSQFGQAEKDAPPNLTLRGFEVFDAAKAAVEAVCPKVVSCADIIALVGRDATVAAGGPSWQVPTGRRDGTVSQLLDAGVNIPASTLPYQVILQNFIAHGFSEDDLITLSGAHTIGRAHCSAFSTRLYPTLDPTLNPAFAAQLQSSCPQNANPNTRVPLDLLTPDVFDINYYSNLGTGHSLMPSDQAILSDLYGTQTSGLNVQNPTIYGQKFVNAMQHLQATQVKLGLVGEIRSNCRVRG